MSTEIDYDYTFGKKEHMCKRTVIDAFFAGKTETISTGCLRMVYRIVDKVDEKSAPVVVLVSVSKRFFKRAVKRNRVKRQIREAYRKHKQIMTDCLVDEMPGKQLQLAFIWQGRRLFASEKVEAWMLRSMQKLYASV